MIDQRNEDQKFCGPNLNIVTKQKILIFWGFFFQKEKGRERDIYNRENIQPTNGNT